MSTLGPVRYSLLLFLPSFPFLLQPRFFPFHKLMLRVDRTSKSSIRNLRNWETRLLNAFHVSWPSSPRVNFTRFSSWTSYRSKVPFVGQLFLNSATSTYGRNAITSGGENRRECTRATKSATNYSSFRLIDVSPFRQIWHATDARSAARMKDRRKVEYFKRLRNKNAWKSEEPVAGSVCSTEDTFIVTSLSGRTMIGQ